MSLLSQDLINAFSFLLSWGWLWAPFLLFFAFKSLWKNYIWAVYWSGLKWITLEVKVPKDIARGPKNTEQIFAGLHGTFLPLRRRDKWWRGKMAQDLFSFEIIGSGGNINFYIRTLESFRNLVEANIYAQYPEAEISIANDYFENLPKILPNENYDLWGNEFILAKEDAYPIRTHPAFEETSGIGEEKRVDPLASLAEVLNTLNPNEKIIIQLLIRPTGEDWAKKAKKIVDKLMGREMKAKRNLLQLIVDALDSLISATSAKEEKKQEIPPLLKLSPGEQEVVLAIERNVAKLGFDSGIRFLYIGPKEGFNRTYVSAIIGVLKQFSTQNLNGFRLNLENMTIAKYPIFKAWREFRKKVKMYQKARNRFFVMQPFVFSTEELATVFHLPSLGVKAPAVQKIEAKKGQPPSGLPT